MEISFDNPQYLWFLACIPLLVALHIFSLKFIRNKAMRFANFEALEKIVEGGKVIPKNYGLLALRFLTLITFVLAASGTVVEYTLTAAEFDYVVAIDASSSMLAQDFSPNRLSATTATISQWVGSLPEGSNVGIVDFSSQVNVVLPLSNDIKKASRSISGLIVHKSGGTAICEAITASTNLLLNSPNPRAIILVSDGQNNVGCLLEDGIAYAKKNNITIFSVGIGSESGGELGETGIFFTLDEHSLKEAAQSTMGKYYRAKDDSQLKSIFSSFSSQASKIERMPLTVYLMLAAFLFVFVEWGLSLTRYHILP